MMRILITLNDQGGAVMSWNFEELAATLRAEMSLHPPVVVLDESFRNDCESSDSKDICVGEPHAH